MTIIIGLDMASCTGVCYGRPNTIPLAEATRAPVTGKDLGPWGAHFFRYFTALLDRLHERLQPGEEIFLVYESPVFVRDRWDPVQQKMVGQSNIWTTRKLQSLGTILEAACEMHVAPTKVYEVNLKTIKKQLTGSGRAEKGAMVAVARKLGVVLPPGDEAMDAADAVGAFLIGCKAVEPSSFAYWNQRLHSGGRLETLSAVEARDLFSRK